ncbi:hypothetical protein [Antarctobacter jejuensis]|uniref:hypothetical protein n=1 Tax=Antarctobacter jejuensis TaxID=1439938 RepID=UPI003FCF87BC
MLEYTLRSHSRFLLKGQMMHWVVITCGYEAQETEATHLIFGIAWRYSPDDPIFREADPAFPACFGLEDL